MNNERTIDRVLRLAKAMDIKQRELADELGVSPQAVTNWKTQRDDMPAGYVPRAAELLGCSIYDLLGLPAENTDWPFPQIPPARFQRLTAGEKLQVQGVMIDKMDEIERTKPPSRKSPLSATR